MTAANEQGFSDLVSWLVQSTPHGTVARLARESGVSQRTLQKWIAGDHPRDRLTRNVEQLDAWAMANAPGYPPPDGTGQRLTTLVRRAAAATSTEPIREPTPGATPASAPEPTASPQRRRLLGVLAAAVALVAVLGVAMSSGAFGNSRSRPRGGTVVEYGDNHRGSPVFSTPGGAASPPGVPPRIPYGTLVHVRCFAPNGTGIASVTALYLVDDTQWHDLWVVSDTMTNGGPVGNTTSPNLDPVVRSCATGEH